MGDVTERSTIGQRLPGAIHGCILEHMVEHGSGRQIGLNLYSTPPGQWSELGTIDYHSL